jgi:hypothetical protein
MFTLQVQNGDLQIGANGFASLNGTQKVYQDLSISTLEPYGCDRFHPRWGSMLYTYIGDAITPVQASMVESEISRLVNNYILVQQDNITSESSLGLQSQYASNEVVASVESVDVIQNQDWFTVNVAILTVAGDQVTLSSQVTNA